MANMAHLAHVLDMQIEIDKLKGYLKQAMGTIALQARIKAQLDGILEAGFGREDYLREQLDAANRKLAAVKAAL